MGGTKASAGPTSAQALAEPGRAEDAGRTRGRMRGRGYDDASGEFSARPVREG